MQEQKDKSKLIFKKWDYAFTGLAIDDRGEEANDFIINNSTEVIEVKYEANEMVLKIKEKLINIDDLYEEFKFVENKRILIEATSLTFAEILLIINEVEDKNCELSILYLEPVSYSKKRTELIVHRREYELTGENLGFIPIPGFINALSEDKNNKVVFIAGYESERIDRGIEENTINTGNCSLIFGVPAFQTGWEMNSFANNIAVIKEQRLSGGVHFASANNPGATYNLLNDIYKSLQDKEELYIAPVGPKPGGIATALFVVKNKGVNILYDHPTKKKTRTNEVGKWHLYDIKF
jgi:hypothetical protein